MTILADISEKFSWYVDKVVSGDNRHKPPREPAHETLKSFTGSFLGILTMALIDEYWLTADYDKGFILIGSFGAAAVLMFNAHQSPLAQPWNVVAGQMVSAFVGVSVRRFCTEVVSIGPVVQKALAVSLAIASMDIFHCLHPPGGATALIAIIGGPKVDELGYLYAVTAGGGAVTMLTVALLFNNIWESRNYPKYYWTILHDPVLEPMWQYLGFISTDSKAAVVDDCEGDEEVDPRSLRVKDIELAVAPTTAELSV